MSATLRAMGYGPKVRGGNGRPLPEPQRLLWEALGTGWHAEYAVTLGPKQPGYPTNYKLDLALPSIRLGVECDGSSHASRRHLDEKKDAKLAELRWTVLRFSNREIRDSLESVAAQIRLRCMTLG